MSVELLRCRICESDYPATAIGICMRCFGPLEPVYDWDAVARLATRERIEAGPASLWRYAALLPADPPDGLDSSPGFTPLVPAPRLAAALGLGEVHLKLDISNPTHSFKDRVVAVAAAKAREFGLDTLSCTSTGNLAGAVAARAAALGMPAVIFCPAGLEPEKIQAATVYGARIYGVRGSYDDCSRLVSELSGEVEWGFVNVNLRSYYAEGSKTLAFEVAEQLGWETPDAVVCPIASGALFSKLWQGFGQFDRLGLTSGPLPRLYGGQPEGCSPVAAAFAENRRVTPVRPSTIAKSLAIGNPADGDLAVETARASGGAIHAVPEDEVGQNMAMLAELAGVFGETAAGVTVGALRAAVAAGQLGESDRVVVLVTGTGLKTPQAVAEHETGSVVEIDADVDALLDELGVTA
ncbi:MAG TPA: threonine synthase [Gaiellaceae bacterium]|nr:threonine synthase [Gaiellaceae bacterium]